MKPLRFELGSLSVSRLAAEPPCDHRRVTGSQKRRVNILDLCCQASGRSGSPWWNGYLVCSFCGGLSKNDFPEFGASMTRSSRYRIHVGELENRRPITLNLEVLWVMIRPFSRCRLVLLYEREPEYTGRRIAACKLDLLQSCRRESDVACCSTLSVCNVVIPRLRSILTFGKVGCHACKQRPGLSEPHPRGNQACASHPPPLASFSHSSLTRNCCMTIFVLACQIQCWDGSWLVTLPENPPKDVLRHKCRVSLSRNALPFKVRKGRRDKYLK